MNRTPNPSDIPRLEEETGLLQAEISQAREVSFEWQKTAQERLEEVERLQAENEELKKELKVGCTHIDALFRQVEALEGK